MEWMECDLSSFHLQRRDRAKFVTHLSEGLQYMHAKCFTHRDLKPQNILIEHNQERLVVVKIADFGTTKHDLFGKMESYAGTNIYMAPEFWESELNYTNAVDMWSLGIVLFEQFIPDAAWSVIWKTSMPPSQEWHEQWRQNELDSRMDDIPPEWRSLVSGLLTLAPEKRWTASRSVEWVRAEEDHLGDDQASAQSTPLASECEGLAEDLDNVDTASAERQVAGTSSPVDTEYDSEIERRYPALQSNIKSQDYS